MPIVDVACTLTCDCIIVRYSVKKYLLPLHAFDVYQQVNVGLFLYQENNVIIADMYMNEYENYIIERTTVVKDSNDKCIITDFISFVRNYHGSLEYMLCLVINPVLCIAIKIWILEHEKYFWKPIHFTCLQMKRYRLKYVLGHLMTIDFHLHSTIFKD